MSSTGLPRIDANVVWLDSTDSTNALAGRLLARWREDNDTVPETVVIAREQRAGRGRAGNLWHSPPGGVYLTWLGGLSVANLPRVPLAAGVAVVESVAALGATVPVRLKWPNDVVASGAKLAGILCQSKVFGAEAWVMVGVGVNVVPLELQGVAGVAATSLRELGVELAEGEIPGRFAAEFVPAFNRAVHSGAEICDTWMGHCAHHEGEALRVRLPQGSLTGRFRGLSSDGALLIEHDGKVETVAAACSISGIEGMGD